MALKVDEDTCSSLLHDVKLENNGKLDHFLRKWYEAQASEVTLEKVLGVLDSMELRRTANETKQFLKKTKHHREIQQIPRF